MARTATLKRPPARANAGKAPAPPSRVRCPLVTIENVKSELARLYREAKSGRRKVQDASRLANMLAIQGRLIEGADLEARIEKILADQRADEGAD